MLDNALLKSIRKEFSWLSSIPVATSILDMQTFQVLACNQLFLDMFNLPDLDDTQVILDGINKLDGSKNVMTLHIGGVTAHVLTSVKTLDCEDKKLLLCTHENLMLLLKRDDQAVNESSFENELSNQGTQIIVINQNMEYMLGGVYNRKGGLGILAKHMDAAQDSSKFTMAFLLIEAFASEKFDEREATNNALSVVKSGIRQTDILAQLNQNDFILIFPKCTNEVVESIMGTIGKKIEVLNETAHLDYDISINYAIGEYDPAKHLTPEQFIESLKAEV